MAHLVAQLPTSSPPDCENSLPSSPPTCPAIKQRRPPPITPRRFNKFFNPRSSRSVNSGSFLRALKDITSLGVNSLSQRKEHDEVEFDDLPSFRPTKKRRVDDGQVESNLFSDTTYLESSPPPSSPIYRSLYRAAYPNIDTPAYPSRIQRSRIAPQQPYNNSKIYTTNFYSDPADVHAFSHPALPFCIESCKYSSLVAIGDENGGIRILESERGGKPEFSTPYVTFKPHDNAIMDMALSSDDYLLATASGDQKSLIVDMRTQQTISVLAEHSSSVKQVSFQPGNDNIVATTSRDGVVALWDIRTNPRIFSAILRGHAVDKGYSSESHSTRGDASVTGLEFLPRERSHLFVTSTDASAQLRVWDIRGRYNRRNKQAIPVTVTAPIPSHVSYRPYGVSSLALSTDAGRLFSVCRDGSVYAYSTNHLALGQSYDNQTSASHPSVRSGREGLGPLFALRHPKLRVSTFYVKADVRSADRERAELLAVGSGDGCAVVFSTDEKSLQREEENKSAKTEARQTPKTKRTRSAVARERSGEVIYNTGTALIRGHSREVTSVSWTSNGDLITVGDDFVGRVWREDSARARDLRMGGETEGRRWGHGWADASSDWDESDDESA